MWINIGISLYRALIIFNIKEFLLKFYILGCGPREEYLKCGSSCPPSCDNYNNTCLACTEQCVSGCFCESDYVRNSDGKCVKPEKCRKLLITLKIIYLQNIILFKLIIALIILSPFKCSKTYMPRKRVLWLVSAELPSSELLRHMVKNRLQECLRMLFATVSLLRRFLQEWERHLYYYRSM